jgi:hypothetical protein
MTDPAVLPLLPSLAALGVIAYALFLAATALGSHRFLQQRSGKALRDTAYVTLFALAWAASNLPVLLASLPAFPVPLSDIGWCLALAMGWLLPPLADRRMGADLTFLLDTRGAGCLGSSRRIAYARFARIDRRSAARLDLLRAPAAGHSAPSLHFGSWRA